MPSPERLPSSPSSPEIARGAAAERSAELQASREKGSQEKSPEHRRNEANEAAKDAAEHAISKEKPAAAEHHDEAPVFHQVNKRTKKVAYKRIVKHTQDQLPPIERTFSKVIHQPVLEKTSEVVGGTVARPNALLFGGLFAFLLTGAVYIIAKHLGYSLSGFESIGAFVIGWALGLLVDFLRITVTGKR